MGSEAVASKPPSLREAENIEFGPQAPPDIDEQIHKARDYVSKLPRVEEIGRFGAGHDKGQRVKTEDMLDESPSDSDSSSESVTSSSASATSSCTSSDAEKIRRRNKKWSGRKTSRVIGPHCDSDSEDEPEKSSRKSKQKRRNDRNGRKEDKRKRDRKRKRDESSDSEESSESEDRGKFRSKEKRDRHRSTSDKPKSRKRRKSRASKLRDSKDDGVKHVAVAKLQVAMEERDQQKALIRRSAELAKARLASGELQRARKEQMEMQRLYGSVDWRAKKKLQSEKKKLERTIAAGNKLAKMEERESARMDAFRVALGLPTAEAQRQAEWRAEATRALNELEVLKKDASPPALRGRVSQRNGKHGIIGPRLPLT